MEIEFTEQKKMRLPRKKKKKLMQSKAVLNRTTAIYLFSPLLQERFKGAINNSVLKQVNENHILFLVFRQHIGDSPKFHKKYFTVFLEKLQFIYLECPRCRWAKNHGM